MASKSIDEHRETCARLAQALADRPALLGLTCRTGRVNGEPVNRTGLTAVRLRTWLDDEHPPHVMFWDPDRVCVALGLDPVDVRTSLHAVAQWRETPTGRKVIQARQADRARATPPTETVDR